jgi:hypothetical protein
VTRIARFANVFIGLLLIVAAFVFALQQPIVLCSDLVSGVVLILVSLPKGEIVERYAGWNKYIK